MLKPIGPALADVVARITDGDEARETTMRAALEEIAEAHSRDGLRMIERIQLIGRALNKVGMLRS